MSAGGEVDTSPAKPAAIISLKCEAEEFRSELLKRGVVYMSRIPPFMKPNKARTMFEQFGEVTRIYLAEEDPSVRKRRKLSGGNASKQFKEGWIEFADKKVAKQVADSLNNTAIGGSKSHFYHDDIWNLKYLKKFKWDYLTEKFSYERRVRENKIKAAMLQSKRANAEFVELVDKSKREKHIERRKREREEDAGGFNGVIKTDDAHSIKRKFRQVSAIAVQPGESLNRVDKKLLSTVFSKR